MPTIRQSETALIVFRQRRVLSGWPVMGKQWHATAVKTSTLSDTTGFIELCQARAGFSADDRLVWIACCM